jgi:superfamily II DNA or RNA helicase
MILRPYQQAGKSAIYAAWAAGARTVLYVLPTGAGKTRTFTNIMQEHRGPSVAIAHRSELVAQMSLSLARNGMQHRIVGQTATAKNCRQVHMAELNRNYISPHARCAAASVQTLVRRAAEPWMTEATLVVIDEGHHSLSANAWGKAAAMFPNAKFLLVTATPCRADGKGLGAHADGIADVMIEGPTMRELIRQGYLTEYRLVCPPSDLDLSHVAISAGGDFSPKPLSGAMRKSHIVGDIVQHYLKYAPGKLGFTFTVDIESAVEVAAAYRAAGVSAEVITGETPELVRAHLMHRFRNREFLQIVSVDVLGEGTDVPAIEVVTMARPTQSLGLYIQQFGRALRPMEGKDKAIIIDPVGNWVRHSLPDVARVWSLDRRERRTRNTPDDVIPVRVCAACLSAYERVRTACPFCGEVPVVTSRSSIEAVDGDLHELDAETLARLRGDVAAVSAAPAIPFGATPVIVASVRKRHRERIEALGSLGQAMALWGGWRAHLGESERETQRRFYLTMGVDVLSAQSLSRADAAALEAKVRGVLDAAGVVSATELTNVG